ncbi:hypothetical protein NDU88_005093 [Pleurodeles waltl]|uniref:Uncharacterized protein n=1 Tax=Pleurodeles waltl TaxID=8319 RepID=A0AAV7NLD2_PLEWA|nr:hypothetical protein NDU88_005093 [Pleurodeles waltl]
MRSTATGDEEDSAGGGSESEDRGLKNETPEDPEGTRSATEEGEDHTNEGALRSGSVPVLDATARSSKKLFSKAAGGTWCRQACRALSVQMSSPEDAERNVLPSSEGTAETRQRRGLTCGPVCGGFGPTSINGGPLAG